MRITAFILLIVLIAIMPIQSYGQLPPGTPQSGSYYFSSNAAGSFPSNSSIFSFCTIGNSSAITAATGEGTNGTGLLLSSCSSSEASYFAIKTNTGYDNFTLSLSFSWNDSRNLGFTEDSILLMSGAECMLNLSFGPKDGYGLIENQNSARYEVSSDPGQNTLCNLSMSYVSGSGSLYFSIGSGGENITFPFMYPVAYLAQEEPTLMLGGYISSFTLYSVNILNESTIHELQLNKTALNPSKTTFNADPFASSYYNGTWFDSRLNTLIGISSSNTFIAYNIENKTFFSLYAGNTLNGSLNVISQDSSLFITHLISNDTASIILTISKSNLSTSAHYIGSPLGEYNSMIGEDGNFTLLGNGGNVAYIENNVLESSFTISGLMHSTLLYASQAGKSTLAAWILNRSIYKTTVFASNASFTIVSQNTSNLISGSYSSLETFSNETSVSSIMIYAGNTTLSLLTSQGAYGLGSRGSPLMKIGGISDSSFSIYDGKKALLAGTDSITMFQGVNDSLGTPIAMSSNGILIMSPGSMTAFYNGTQALISGGSPTASVDSSYVVRGQASMNFSIHSTSEYHAVLAFANHTFFATGPTVTLNSSVIPDGSYGAVLNLSNIQGFVSTYTFTVVIDNGNPDLLLSISNNSYVPQSFRLTLNYTFWAQISHMKVTYDGSNISLSPENQTVGISFGNITGNQTIAFNLTDVFGISHMYQINVHVISNSTEGFHINLSNGTYLNRTEYSLSWSPVPYVEDYDVIIHGLNFSANISTGATATNLKLENGNLTISLTAIQLDGRLLQLATLNIYVVAYAPSISITGNTSGYYSFFGNSSNNSFALNAKSNSTATVSLEVIAPNGVLAYAVQGSDHVNFSSANERYVFSANGLYTVMINATGPSGLSSGESLHISVNNTVPPPLYSPGTHIYTNSSLLHVGSGQIAGTSYLYVLSFNGTSVEESDGGLFTLLNGTGNYSMTIYEINTWSSRTTLHVTITYETQDPVISISQASQNSENISYTVRDAAPLASLYLQYLNHTIYLDPSNMSGKLSLGISQNTKFNLTISAIDDCGNSATAQAPFLVTDYVNVTSASLEGFSILGIGFFQIKLSGQNVANASVFIVTPGGNSTGSYYLDLFMPFGYSTASAIIEFNGHRITETRQVFSIGWYPLILAAVIVLIFLSMRRMGQTSDPEKIEAFVRAAGNQSLKEISRKASKLKINRKALNARIDVMSRQGLIKIEEDPDGEAYVMLQETR